MSILLPNKLESKLKGDLDYYTLTLSFIKRIKPFIESKKLDFFPEYSDHSIQHNQEVISSCQDLIAEAAYKPLTPQDISILVASVFMHDLGMHLSIDIFYEIIFTDHHKLNPITPFDRSSWKELWLDYMSEAKRWDSRKLISIFGKPEPVSDIPVESLELSSKHKLLIGEFIRRHHGRLAHEMSVFGYPVLDDQSLDLLEGFSDEQKNLIGLIARSHTIGLRDTFDYLERNFDLRDFNGIHAVYLMILLRVSDYLQLQPERIPNGWNKIMGIKSPISQNEWKVHECVKNITTAIDDPEAIKIIAQPEHVNIFLRVRNWIEGIQEELDRSWAILGEVYGRYIKEDYDKFTLTLRRIKCNLIDDFDRFAETVSYLPKKIQFDSANPDLLKLLIKPLYGDRPEIGIRELLQNSLDAVREKHNFLRVMAISEDDVFFNSITEDIEILVECNDRRTPTHLVVTDKGIGMTKDVLQNFFLKAGATFRRSHQWKVIHEDESGYSNVLRSGRFGIGALAAFLIGNELEVQTRHISQKSDQGLYFKASLDDEMIYVERNDCPVGTKIRVVIDPRHVENFESWINNFYAYEEWDWYYLQWPSVSRKSTISDRANIPSTHQDIPHDLNTLNHHWLHFKPEDFDGVFFNYDSNFPELIVNGLVISREGVWHKSIIEDNGFRFKMPNLSIFDPNGYSPINLQRDNITTNIFPFNKDLEKEILTLAAVFLIISRLDKSFKDEFDHKSRLILTNINSNHQRSFDYNHTFDSEHGIGLVDPMVLADCDFLTNIGFIHESYLSPVTLGGFTDLEDYAFIKYKEHITKQHLHEKGQDVVRILSKTVSRYSAERFSFFPKIRSNWTQFLISNEHMREVELYFAYKHIDRWNLISENEQYKWFALPGNDFESPFLRQVFDHPDHFYSQMPIADWELSNEDLQEYQSNSKLAEKWHDIVGGHLIPNNLPFRQELLAKLEKDYSSYYYFDGF